jgi:hypothetical protein
MRTKLSLALALVSILLAGPALADSRQKTAESKDKVGDGFHMETSVQAGEDGQLVGTTKVESTNDLHGFTGAAAIFFVDAEGNIIFPRTPKEVANCVATKGVEARSKAEKKWAVAFPPDSFGKVQSIAIIHAHVPKDAVDAWTRDAKKILEVGGKVVDVNAKFQRLKTGK